jgi:3-phosphoshikimate 1-carboxyvinyltransferase
MKWIKHSEVNGTVTAPPSKSMMLRATAIALLSQKESQIFNHSECDDVIAGFRVARALGARITSRGNNVKIVGGESPQGTILDCGESGLCMRMFAPIAGLFDTKLTLTGSGSLQKRPMGMIEPPLNQLGAVCKTENGFPPIQIRGPMYSGKVSVDGSLSSQFLTGLLIALPFCKGDSEISVVELKSKPYVHMTLSMLEHAGVSIDYEKDLHRFFIPGGQLIDSLSMEVEGDWSGASFLLVAGAICGKVTVQNLRLQSTQADIRILEALGSSNAKVFIASDSVTVEESDLSAFQFDATECPDLFPPLAVLACHCRGQSLISGVERLQHKESNRARALFSELTKIGAKISISGNRMAVTRSRITGGLIESHGDHRIAMAGAVAGLSSTQGVGIQDWECVSKSYPRFFEDLKLIGGVVS